jgi:Bacterial protein of unknown function (DUF899)
MQNQIASHEKWLKARLELLAAEKEFTRQRDALTRRRMAMPWERVEKFYQFEGPSGTLSLADLFDGRSQLIVYHFMFAPDWEPHATGRALAPAGSRPLLAGAATPRCGHSQVAQCGTRLELAISTRGASRWVRNTPTGLPDCSPIRAHQINLQRSLIDRTINRFGSVSHMFGFAVGTGIIMAIPILSGLHHHYVRI